MADSARLTHPTPRPRTRAGAPDAQTRFGEAPDTGPTPAASHRRPAWARAGLAVAAVFAGCTALGLLFAGHWYALGPPTDWAGALRETLPRWYVWGMLAPLIAWADRRLAAGRGLPARLALLAVLGLGWTALAVLAQGALRPLTGAALPGSWGRFVAIRYPWDALVYGAVAGALVARDYVAEARRRERGEAALAVRAARLEAGLVEARLHALGAQLHPHFLFNALNTINAHIAREPATARRLMAELGGLLRASLDHAARPEVPLAEELAFLDAYLAIERARFGDRLAVAVRADPDALGAAVPGFLLQPLVENAIKHGVGPRAAGGRVDVAVRRADGRLVVAVLDDGVGLPAGWDLAAHAGVGLGNVAGRLAALYPGQHRLHVGPAAGGGVRVEVDLPFRPEPRAAPAPATFAPVGLAPHPEPSA